MKNRLRQLHELYKGGDGHGHASEPTPEEATPDEQAALEQELITFREMKELLDRRARRSPDPAAVSAVLAAARGEAVPRRSSVVASIDKDAQPTTADRGVRKDRPPVARQRSTVLRIGATSALVAIFLAVVGILQFELFDPINPSITGPQAPTASESPSPADSERASSPTDDATTTNGAPVTNQGRTADRVPTAESKGRSESQSVRGPQHRPSSPLARFEMDAITSHAETPAEEAETADRLSWDSRADVMEVFEHIEMVSGGVAQDWDPSPVPLEMLTDDNARGEPFLQQAGQRRP